MQQVFKKYLTHNNRIHAAELVLYQQGCRRDTPSWGVAVLAHPGRYNLTAKWLKRLIGGLPMLEEMLWKLLCHSKGNNSGRLCDTIQSWLLRGAIFIIFTLDRAGQKSVVTIGCRTSMKDVPICQ